MLQVCFPASMTNKQKAFHQPSDVLWMASGNTPKTLWFKMENTRDSNFEMKQNMEIVDCSVTWNTDYLDS